MFSTTDIYFDPYDVEINADPYPVYERLREDAPVYYNERYEFWALSRHSDVHGALLNWQTFSNTRSDILDIIKAGVELPPGVILFEDPPLHTTHRGLMSRVFTPRRMAALEDQVRAFCIACLDPLVGSGGFDVVAELGAVLPMRVIGMLLGVPAQDQVAMRTKTDADLRTRPGQPMQVREESVANGDMFADYIDWRAEHPSDDLMTQLLNAEFEDEHGEKRTLTRQEVLTYTAVIAGAGNETTGRLIGWLAKLLAEHPEQRRDVVKERSLIPKVIEESLRFEPTGHATARVLTHDAEYHGTTVPAGSAMLLLIGSAQRDPPHYAHPPPPLRPARRVRHPPGGHVAPHVRVGRPPLPRRRARPPRRTRRARRVPEPLSRVGRRPRRHRARADVDRARLAAHADRLPVTSSASEPVVVVSNDTHIGPRLVEDLRDYCPSQHLDEFDRFAAETATDREAAVTMLEGSGYLDHPNFRTAGHHDSAARLADYDHDGIAAGVIFHGSMNLEPIPFVASALGRPKPTGDLELVGVGQSIYNRWLADFVATAPHRHIGLAYLPMWDVDAAVSEVEWAQRAGLRGVNFPAMRDGDLPPYNRRAWEPLWAVCDDLGMPLVTHVGGGTNTRYSGLESVALLQLESAMFSRRAVWWLISAGVFERHPGLKLVITETPGNWFPPTATELDTLHAFYDSKRDEPLNKALLEQVPRRPSEYMMRNVFFGASFASPLEVHEAVEHGLASQLLWGSDYPHLEGTFVYRDDDELPSVTRLALRNTFCGVATAETRRMVG